MHAAARQRSIRFTLAASIAESRRPVLASLRFYTDRVCLDSDPSWLKVPIVQSDHVQVRIVNVGLRHLWAMYAVFWVASGHYVCAGVCAGVSALLIFYP
jgi:hypothetical protein